MEIPLQVVFRGFPRSDAVEAKIREKVAKLERFHPHMISCRVAVEEEHHRHHQGNRYHVRIDITTPHREIVVSHEHHDNRAYEDVYVALRDAFNAAARQLEDYVRIQRGYVKEHHAHSNGTVARLVPEQDYGFITSEDGREIYFHRHSVIGKEFDELQVGDAVRFDEEEGERGPQASTVHA